MEHAVYAERFLPGSYFEFKNIFRTMQSEEQLKTLAQEVSKALQSLNIHPTAIPATKAKLILSEDLARYALAVIQL
jgi:hypothetical protein